jgi:protein-S-isoprenylcysteine O-methyltransferase Ste14
LIFIYGLSCYLFFFATFCYAIGFVTGLVVPKTIDDGPIGPAWISVVINVGFLALFAIQHTIMARPAFKRWWTRIIPPAIERSTFVLLATAILAAMMHFWRPIPDVIWNVEQPILRGILTGISLLGFGIVLYASCLIDHFDLFGLRQVVLFLRNRPYAQRPFMERSLYRVVRHPLMLGFMMAFWVTPTMTLGHLLFAGVTTGYIFFGTWIEERDLVQQHGDRYLSYRRRVRGLLPVPKRQTADPRVVTA